MAVDICTISVTHQTAVCMHMGRSHITQAVREAATICPAPCKLTFDLLTLKVLSESRVTWATSVPILVFLDIPVQVW